MTGAFRCEPLADLTKQLLYAPAPRRRQHVDHAEQLYWQTDPRTNYPLDYVIYRITGYRADTSLEPATLVGAALRDDLLALADALARSLDLTDADLDQPFLTTEQLADELSVSPRTVKRYRKQGLFARYVLHNTPRGPRKRAVFLSGSVERFRAARGEKLDQAAAFQRLTDADRHAMIIRARRIASRTDASPFRVSVHLARRFDCHPETIRRLLIQHDARDPRFAIFRDYRAPLSDREQRLIARAYHRGVRVRRLRERFGRRADAIYRAVNLQRARALSAVDLSFVPNPTFELPDADAVILGPELPAMAAPTPRRGRGTGPHEGRDVIAPPIDGSAEAALFARYNYLKCLAAAMRDRVDPVHPTSRQLDEAETLVRRAQRVRWRIERAFAPIVDGVARRHHGSGQVVGDRSLATLQRIGRRVMHAAIDTFDVAKASRFHTQLGYALMRRFAQQPRRGRRARRPSWSRFTPPATEVLAAWQAVLGAIDDRQRRLVSLHFGAVDSGGEPAEPHTLGHAARLEGIGWTMAQRQARLACRGLLRRGRERGLHLSDLLPLRDVPGVQ